ncbi:MAG: iron-containing alcohol dehydrogenase [Planctomycetaceae bacterium]
MSNFDFAPRTRIVCGAGKLEALGDLAVELGAKRVLVVSDPGIIAAGHSQRGIEILKRAGLEASLFGEIQENPSTRHVAVGVAAANEFKPDLLVGLGGGSAMDCAKGINFLYTNGGQIKDYWGVGKATKPMLPMIAVPTTAGTGSETQSFALISDEVTHVKMACGDKKAACKVALLDPELTVTQPPRVTALTGIDAISHAVETYVTNKRNTISLLFSREAFRLLAANFGTVLQSPKDLQGRANMQLGACFAGMAIENSMLGIAHSLANPLTAHYGIPHGQAVSVMLPFVVLFNGSTVAAQYADLAQDLPEFSGELPEAEDLASRLKAATQDAAVRKLAHFLWKSASLAGLKLTLAELGVEAGELGKLSEEAAKQWTATFNPRPVTSGDLLSLYQAAF